MEIKFEVGTYVKLNTGEIRQVVGGTIELDDGDIISVPDFTILTGPLELQSTEKYFVCGPTTIKSHLEIEDE